MLCILGINFLCKKTDLIVSSRYFLWLFYGVTIVIFSKKLRFLMEADTGELSSVNGQPVSTGGGSGRYLNRRLFILKHYTGSFTEFFSVIECVL